MSAISLYLSALYFFTLGAVFFARFTNVNVGNFLSILVAIIAFIIAALRPWYFPDVDTYELIYDHGATGDFNNPLYWAAHGEPGFKIFTYVASISGINYDEFLILMASISCMLLIYISRISNIPFAYLWFTYFSFYFITRDLGVIRLSIASHLIVIAFLQRKMIWHIFTLAIATLTFQYFAFVAILARFMSRLKINWLSILILFGLSFSLSSFLSFDGISFLLPEETANNYQDSAEVAASTSSIIVPVTRNLFFALLIFYLLKDKTNHKLIRLLIWAALLSATMYVMTSGILVVAQRFAAYFGAAVPLTLAYLMHSDGYKNHQFLLIIIFAILNFISLFYFNNFVWAPDTNYYELYNAESF